MRLFTAIELPAEVRNHLSGIQTYLQTPSHEIQGVKWVEPANLHVTLKFFGEIEEGRLWELQDALKTVHVEAMPLFADRFIRLPARGPARVLAAEIGGDAGGVAQLVERIELAVEPMGFEREHRPFRAHVTLGRARDGVRLRVEGGLGHDDPLFRLDLSRQFPGPSFETSSFTLFKSTLTTSGPVYESLMRFSP